MSVQAAAFPDFPPRSTETGRLPPWQRQVQDYLDVRVLVIGGVAVNQHWVGPDYYASFWRLYHNRQAGVRLMLSNGSLDIPAGHTVIIPPWVHFDARCHGRVEHCFIHFLVPAVPDRVVQRVWAEPLDLGPGSQGGKLIDGVVVGMVGRTDPRLEDLCLVKAGVIVCLTEAFARLPATTVELLRVHLMGASLFKDLVAIIDAHPAFDWSVDELARRSGLTRDNLTRQLKKQLGITPGGLVTERRLLSASQRLLSSEDSIEDIAEACGFANRFSFSRSFTRRFAVAPAAYRQRGW